MERKGISQEGLKLIACAAMLTDHIGAVFVPGIALRLIGRMAFPIYCFLLTEGIRHTRDPKRYALRLLTGMVLAELPFDLLFFGGWNWGKQSVMATLMLGFLYCMVANRASGTVQKVLLLFPFALLGEAFRVDYGGWGVVMTGFFLLTGEQSPVLKILGLGAISCVMSRATVSVGFVQLPMQLFSLTAMIPISLYEGRKRTKNVWVQRMFYLFYPVHMAVLYLLRVL